MLSVQGYETVINFYEAEVSANEALIATLYKRLEGSERRRRAHFLELDVLKREYKVASRRLGKKRRNIRNAKSFLTRVLV